MITRHHHHSFLRSTGLVMIIVLLMVVTNHWVVVTDAFVGPLVSGCVGTRTRSNAMTIIIHHPVPTTNSCSSTTTALQERKWNFNDGQAPWGLKKNAEIWNGRFAQVRLFFGRLLVPIM